jgi:hypothetical protein
MIRRLTILFGLNLLVSGICFSQSPGTSPAASVWNAVSAPAMDPAKSARVENLEIVRDGAHIILKDGTIRFAQPVNGIVYGASFRGSGVVHMEAPNPIEQQQLVLFTKQNKINYEFGDATFSFTDGLFDEIAKQVKWQTPSTTDDLYASRQKTREDLGQSAIPRIVQGILSSDHKRTAFFLADLKLSGKDWMEIVDDSLEAEDINVGRWVDVGAFRSFDVWMSFPSAGKTSAAAWSDPQAKEDFSIRSFTIDSSVTPNAELHATAKLEIEPRLAGQNLLLFNLDSNLRVESVKDEKGALTYYQSREGKDRI